MTELLDTLSVVVVIASIGTFAIVRIVARASARAANRAAIEARLARYAGRGGLT